jgi:hypothetical protein
LLTAFAANPVGRALGLAGCRNHELLVSLDLFEPSGQPNSHFFEWLASVLIFESTGYLSLIEKYAYKHHTAKFPVFCEVIGAKLSDWICEDSGWSPDLFCYSPDKSDWFLCEVKGDRDKIRPPQRRWAKRIYKRTGKKTLLIKLKPLSL